MRMTGKDPLSLRGSILVGFDGSPDSERALLWAIDEARIRGRPVTICHAWQWPYPTLDELFPYEPLVLPYQPLLRRAHQLLHDGASLARRRAPEVPISTLLERDSPARALLRAGERAEMIVVGSRGCGGFVGLPLGSVSSQVATHARCPVVAVRGRKAPAPGDHPDQVVVAVDGSSASLVAFAFAFDEAAAHHLPVAAIWAQDLGAPCILEERTVVMGEISTKRRTAEKQLQIALIPWREKYPDVEVHPQTADAPACTALLPAANTARLLVVISRRNGVMPGLLDAQSQAILYHAPCPVAVIHPQSELRENQWTG